MQLPENMSRKIMIIYGALNEACIDEKVSKWNISATDSTQHEKMLLTVIVISLHRNSVYWQLIKEDMKSFYLWLKYDFLILTRTIACVTSGNYTNV
ncbi:predicted protein [Botrytis cinerea T4]|uniref:Uncharacterized protein n=1 Tax=Botryotinia fuckeliana (strain T4) TaxID=999810 RepID=G2XXX3_BOTF4|nr:predicted protein [Botrytis cinerea T4]